jgi:hypothetical protein
MLATFEDIMLIDDLLYNITKYLPFNHKIMFSRICKKNLIRFYDFDSEDYKYKKLYHLIDDIDNDFIGNIKYYINYYYILDEYININKRLYIDHGLLDDIDFENRTIDEICKLSSEEFFYLTRYRNCYTRFSNIFDEDLEDIIFRSIYGVYIRIMIEHSEEYEIDLQTHDHNEIDISKEIKDYYVSVIHEETDLDTFCSRCGSFGHDNISESCILYNEKFRDKQIKREVSYVISDMLKNVCDLYEDKVKGKKKLSTQCKGVNCNGVRSCKCVFAMCKKCCKLPECFYHYNKYIKKIEIQKQKNNVLKCKADKCKSFRSSKCISELCKICCKSPECSYHNQNYN